MRGNIISIEKFNPPNSRVSKFEINNEIFYSMRTFAAYAQLSDTTIRRRIKRNDIYHSKVNDRVFFAEWQLLVHKALRLGNDEILRYRILYNPFDGPDEHGRLGNDFFDEHDRNRRMQFLLEKFGKVEVKVLKDTINDVVKEKNGIAPEHPCFTTEYLVSKYAWCRYNVQENLLLYDYSRPWTMTLEEFEKLKKILLANKHEWKSQDIKNYLWPK